MAMGRALAVDPANIHNLREHFHIVTVKTSQDAHRRYGAIARMPRLAEGTEAEGATAASRVARETGTPTRRGA